jgi:threonine dehydrogenase-like Zn-dependent dehydrogenase
VARDVGATFVSADTTPVKELPATIGAIDVVYEATGVSKLAFDAMPHLGVNGVFVFTGIPGASAPIELNADAVMRNLVLKNQIVFGTVNAGKDAFEAAIDDLGAFVKRWPQAVHSRRRRTASSAGRVSITCVDSAEQ